MKNIINKNKPLEIINSDDEEFLHCIIDLLDRKEVQKMKEFCQHGSTSTFEHSLLVSYKSFKISKKLRLNFREASRGGLLHDLFLYDWHDKNACPGLHGFYHPKIALKNAEKLFSLTKKEKDIIKKHMWPLTLIPPKSPEAFIVCYCDKICALKEISEQFFIKTTYIFRMLYGKLV